MIINNFQSEQPNSRPVFLSQDVAASRQLSADQLEHAQTLPHDSPDIFLKAAMNIAAVDFFTVLNRFDTVTLTKSVEEKPELYFQLLNSYANLMRANLEQEKFRFRKKQAESRQRGRDQKLRIRKPILVTNTTLNTLARALALEARGRPVEPNSESTTASPVAAAIAASQPVQMTTDNERRTTPNRQPSTTVNSSRTEAVDVSASLTAQLATDLEQLTTDRPEPGTNPEPCCEPAWSDAPAEDLICCPS